MVYLSYNDSCKNSRSQTGMSFLKKSGVIERPISHVTTLINITVLFPLCVFLKYI